MQRNKRTVKRADSDLDNDLDEERLFYYSAAWQLIEERIADDYPSSSTIDRTVQTVWGARYIDDAVLRR